ncbi:DeoR/GlpR transcriptional regulator [Pseudoflavonifractor sp. AF19-9AC]|uniref:DeoR/GlpR family DNA-binding transcription regulator n=1 Tax=Pseudoflavonifractor sp. AF19-9AC TaxID=2292244 RepID=UPI000E4D61AE|nr:DeoR/GlpR family DNA-binding transcription regulator [Pseudoflavonifractor sp. AF19-9AC]RHR06134.1 DeoR/GlpR transcriptional regulator [Pseudoflavonifractor sp. AF19-9AC]
MLKPERYRRILDYVNERGAATVDELADVTQVSKATIRRDLVALEEERSLLRTHGGAVTYHSTVQEEIPIDLRRELNREEKELVAAAAVELVREGSTIYVGAGTTGRALAAKLGRFHQLTVLTNDLDVAQEVTRTDNSLIMAGGQLKKGSRTLYGFFTEQMLRELRVDTAFMIVDAVDVESGFMDYSIDEVRIKREVIQNAKQCIMLCDASKFKKSTLVNVCPLNHVQVVVTNAEADPKDVQVLMDAGLQVIQAARRT